jgi:CPA1 family monovalent cation:H+ antiporter
VLTVTVVLVTRFTWIYLLALLHRRLNPSLARRYPLPPWQWLLFLGFIGMRGIASLAAALAIPLNTAAGTLFPDRDLIVTFGLIVVTLIGQGLLLPSVVRWLGLTKHTADERQCAAELGARSEALNVGHGRLKQFIADGGISPRHTQSCAGITIPRWTATKYAGRQERLRNNRKHPDEADRR